ncbi:MBL fold metallo-hydrolase [Clostridium aestuarii]|uniref:MBL fold metallo-hydrolase n=1 Tax=Clostridium aestuarii TaxID=338193 RepID=A0ABT4D0R0_9CLOT|nr:MBL fold metallo-hydrolase [Clostridium aestuarii]MCY6484207.1 MBL fold metallo-hydrolase [Clostridium aestuarii]
MELTKIKGNTYYIDSPTNIGVYVFKNKFCALIDSGLDNSAAKKFDDILKNNGLHPKYIINTHAHLDHCGGNHYFNQNYTGTIVYTSQKEKLYMENPQLLSTIVSSAPPIKKIAVKAKPFKVDYILEYGTNKINDEKFEIIPLKGHSEEHIGIITPEKVCFLGDCIFSAETLDKYPFPFLFDIEASIETLENLREVDADYFVISHGKNILTKAELLTLIDKNIENIEKYIDMILELLDQPCTREDILENIMILDDISVGIRKYMLNLSSISAFISYLYNKDLIDCSIEDGKLYYFKK